MDNKMCEECGFELDDYGWCEYCHEDDWIKEDYYDNYEHEEDSEEAEEAAERRQATWDEWDRIEQARNGK